MVINPVVVPLRTDLAAVQRALPEVLRLQPAGVPREILFSNGHQHGAFARDLGGLIAAPVNSQAFDSRGLVEALVR